MDQDVLEAIERHEDKFGEFNATIIALNLSRPEVKRRLMGAIDQAIASNTPISDADLGIEAEPGVMI